MDRRCLAWAFLFVAPRFAHRAFYAIDIFARALAETRRFL